MGVLGAGTAKKGGSRCAYSLRKGGGGLSCGHSQKKGGLRPRGLRYVYNPKRGEFRTFFLVKREVLGSKVGQKWILGAYLFIILTSICQHDQLVGVCSGRLKKWGGPRCGRCCSTKGVLGGRVQLDKGGLRCGSGKKGGSLPLHTPVLDIYVSAPPPPGPKTPILLGYARI